MSKKLTVFSWAMYDFANNIFAMNIMSRYFPLWVVVDKKAEDILYSFSLSFSLILVAIVAPIIGMISDRLQRRMIFVISFTLLSVFFSAFIGLTQSLFWGLLFFAVANFGYQIAGSVYNALLPEITPKAKIGRVSGYGKMFGYSGAIVGLILVGPFVARGGRQWAFIPSAVFFLLFSLPCFIFVKEGGFPKEVSRQRLELKKFLGMLKRTFIEVNQHKNLRQFLFTAFMVLNAVSAIMVFMSVYAERVIGFSGPDIDRFLIFSTLVAIFGCFSSGFIADRWGAKRTLAGIIILWFIALILAVLTRSRAVFWIIGPLAGIALGSTWVVSRALVVDLAPAQMMAQVFGLFTLVGVISALSGTFIWGFLTWSLRFLGVVKYRITCLVLSLFFIAGLWLLRKIPNITRRQ